MAQWKYDADLTSEHAVGIGNLGVFDSPEELKGAVREILGKTLDDLRAMPTFCEYGESTGGIPGTSIVISASLNRYEEDGDTDWDWSHALKAV